MEFDIDPLFKKTSKKFDEGGAASMLLNTLSVSILIALSDTTRSAPISSS